MAYTANDIAKWFLIRNNTAIIMDDADKLGVLKLLKLVYYAQGVYVAYTEGEVLFSEDILAWDHGPVVYSVYSAYKANSEIDFTPTESDFETFRKIQKDEIIGNVLEVVFNHYGKFTAWALRNMTHDEAPWKNTGKNEVIDIALIRNYFEREVLVD